MDGGNARKRRRFRVYPKVIDVAFLFTQAQYAEYVRFCEEDLNGWTDWFMLPIKDEKGLRHARVNFIERPGEVYAAPRWRVAGQVETLVNA